MKYVTRSLPLLITAALASSAIQAQDESSDTEAVVPGLYTTTDEGRTYLIQGDQTIEIAPGQAAFATEDGLELLERPPKFLDWPCTTQAAMSRKFAVYDMEDLPDTNRIQEIIRRYFEIPEVIEPQPRWKDGEYHGRFSRNEFMQFSAPEYWYIPDGDRAMRSEKRPRSLFISLYVGINQVVVDSHALNLLREEFSDNDIPVTFIFNDSDTVPVSYFGPNVSLEELLKAYMERGIRVAQVPMWELGDHHLKPSIEEFEKYFDIPELDAISPERRSALQLDLGMNGFYRKPIFVSIFADSGEMSVDEAARIRVAASMGISNIPTVVTVIVPDDIYVQRCGPGIPIGTSGSAISGESTPIGGATVPPGSTTPPPTDPAASDS